MRSNPYIGPRSFRTGETLYGRDRELRRLLDLLIAERIVLLHAPSGAGKTSLVQAALIPSLRAEGFAVLRPMRLGASAARRGALPTPTDDILRGLLGIGAGEPERGPPANRYVLSALLSLEEELPPERQFPVEILGGMTLGDYLDLREGDLEPSDGVALIFDQFEEILTVDPTDTTAREQFFAQLGDALTPRHRWALFSMREDYVGALEPFVRPIPTQLGNTFHLDLLDVEAAAQAMQGPARAAGVAFADAAARRLCDDLRRVRLLHPDGTTGEQLGPYVEPVQLQVVCFRLWERLPEGAAAVGPEDVTRLGDVDSALTGYYAERVRGIAEATGVGERAIRDWCEGALITEQGIRGQVAEGAAGLDRRAIAGLVDAHLVRGEQRRGATWFELAHDRLIAPVRADNAAWREANLSELQRQAAVWDRQGRPEGLLFRGAPLAEAEAWAEANAGQLSPTEADFLAASRAARAAAERERQTTRRIRWLGIASAVAMLAAVSVAALAIWQYVRAQEQARAAFVEKLLAQASEYRDQYPQRAALLSIEALRRSEGAGQGRAAVLTALYDSLDTLGGTPLQADATGWVPTLSANGRYFARVDLNGRARVWETLGDGRPIAALDVGDDRDFVPGPDGGYGVSYSYDVPSVTLWDLRSPTQPVASLPHPWSIDTVLFSPDGRLIVTGARERGQFLLWRVGGPNDRPAAEFELEPSPNWEPFFTPAGGEVVFIERAGQASARLARWQLGPDGALGERTTQELQTDYSLVWRDEAARFVAFYSRQDEALAVIDLAADGPRARRIIPVSSPPAALAFSQATGELAVAFQSRALARFSLLDGAPLPALSGAPSLSNLTYSPDGQYLFGGSAEGRLYRWRVAAEDAMPVVLGGHEDRVYEVHFIAGSDKLLSFASDGTPRVWAIDAQPPSAAARLSPDGGSYYGTIWFDVAGRALLLIGRDTISSPYQPQVEFIDPRAPDAGPISSLSGEPLHLSPDRRFLFLIKAADALALLRYDLTNLAEAPREIRLDQIEGSGWPIAVDTAARHVVLVGDDPQQGLRIWDSANPDAPPRNYATGPDPWRRYVRTSDAILFWAGDGSVRHLALSDLGPEPTILVEGADANIILSADERYALLRAGQQYAVADLATGALLAATIPVANGRIESFAVDPARSRLVAANDYTARERLLLWDLSGPLARPTPLTQLEIGISPLMLSPDGRWLANVNVAGDVELWELEQLLSPETQQGDSLRLGEGRPVVSAVQFTPDGMTLLARDTDGGMLLWPLDPAVIEARLCAVAGRNLSWQEWRRFIQVAGVEETYRRTCESAPSHRTYLASVQDLVARDGRDAAMARIQELNLLEPGLIEDPNAYLDGAQANSLLVEGEQAMGVADLSGALRAFAEARRLSPQVTPSAWVLGEVCRLGAQQRRPAEVLAACDEAVARTPFNLNPVAVRAVVYALLGDTEASVADIEAFIHLVGDRPGYEPTIEERRAWIAALRAGEPMLDAMIADLEAEQ